MIYLFLRFANPFCSDIAHVLQFVHHCRILPFYYYYWELENQMRAAIRVASTDSDAEIREKLLYQIKRMDIPARPEDLKIGRTGRHMNISLKYSEVFDITWKGKDRDLRTFNFHARAEGDF